jgi:hypothetical protein
MLHVLVCVTPHARVLASLWLETRPNEQIYLFTYCVVNCCCVCGVPLKTSLCTGGCGKTTMAAVLFNKLSRSTNEFAKAAMVELQLEGNSPDQLTNCLVLVLKDLGEEKPKGSNMQLLQQLAELMQQHKVLLLLDNVNHADQLDSLLPSQFSSGSSRVIITSRDEKLPSSEAYLVSATA